MAYQKLLNKIAIKQPFSILLMMVCLNLSFFISESSAWLIYNKPAFKGKVIDAETKEPIEGAVVVVIYKTHTIIGSPAGGDSSIIKVKETLTDKSGEFNFPSYTTVTNPNASEYYADFIIYKPGYAGDANYPKYQINPPSFVDWEKFFSEEYGTKKEIYKRSRSAIVTYGVVELPRVKTKKERLRAKPSRPTDVGSKELPLLYKAINDERKRLGLKGEVK